MQQHRAKKGIMFLKGEDFYYLSYNIVMLLNELKCYGNPKKFKDARKLAFLIEFAADKNLLNTLVRSLNYHSRNHDEKRYMANAYSESLVRVKQITRLLFALEQKGIVSLEKDSKRNTISVWLNREEIPESFWNKKLFKEERQNIAELRKHVKRLSSLTLDTLKEKLFESYGIHTWDI